MVNNSSRFLELDFTRSLCVLWIVGFWHLQYYVAEDLRPSGNFYLICKYLTNGILATFTLLSGFFLKKYSFDNAENVKQFYLARIKRFYILYALSAVTMFLMSGGGITRLISALLGLSMFWETPLPTLWYFSMLIIFYAVTPLMPKFGQSVSRRLLVTQLIWTLVIFSLASLFADKRFIMYLPFYIISVH